MAEARPLRRARAVAVLALALAPAACGEPGPPPDVPASAPPVTLTVYTDRDDPPLRAALDAWAAASDTRVRVVRASAGRLVARLAREREEGAARADLVLVDDASLLAAPGMEDLLAGVTTDRLEGAVPEGLRDPRGRWWGVAQRARLFVLRCGEEGEGPRTLAELADDAWAGRVLVGSDGPTTLEALAADVAARDGAAAGEAWAAGAVRAPARPPAGDDAAQVAALVAGEGDVAVVEGRALARAVAGGRLEAPCVRYPDQDGAGTPVRVTAAAVVAGAPRRARAVALLERLVGDDAQRRLARDGHEIPVRPDVPWSPTLLAWGGFRAASAGPAALAGARGPAVAALERARALPDSVSPGGAPGGGAAPEPPARRPSP